MSQLFRKVRILVRTLMGQEVSGRADINLPCERFGSAYGGWHIVTEQLSKDSIVYSFGIGYDVTFDVAIIERFGLTVHGFDPTPKSLEWVKRQELPAEFVMHEYGLADFDGTVRFNGPPNPKDISFSICEEQINDRQAVDAPVRRLKTIIDELGHQEIAVLKMDIEGAEYKVVRDLLGCGIRPGQILIEYHHRFPSIGIQRTLDSMNEIRQAGYQLFSVSESRLEFGFIRNDLACSQTAAA
ncbi:MAG: FkbM family methyltransferase [Planctomycetaceae bacterium]